MQARNTGWRNAASINNTALSSYTDNKSDLFEAARLCCRVINLPSSCRFLLDQLCAAYGGQLIEGRMLVWPSNNYLGNRTGLSERTIRFALQRLISEKVIEAKDSPNGKRYARKDAYGNVVTAYGFDLTPLLHRLSEFRDRMVAIEERDRERRRMFDEITITRRNAQELLYRLVNEFPKTDCSEYVERIERLSQALPRRSSKKMPCEALELWKTVYEELKTEVIAATGGEDCRHKDTNKNPLKSSCYKGSEVDKAKPVRKHLADAVQILGDFRHEFDMFEQADRYRGMLGVSKDAWLEARRLIGDEDAARLMYLVTQIQAKPSHGAQQIKNFGGYFRVLTRKIAEGGFDLDAEISRRNT